MLRSFDANRKFTRFKTINWEKTHHVKTARFWNGLIIISRLFYLFDLCWQRFLIYHLMIQGTSQYLNDMFKRKFRQFRCLKRFGLYQRSHSYYRYISNGWALPIFHFLTLTLIIHFLNDNTDDWKKVSLGERVYYI